MPPALDAPERLAALRASGLLDSPAEEAFDRITRVAAAALGAPIANFTLVDDVRQFWKSRFAPEDGPDAPRGTPLSHSYCKHVVETNAPLVVADAREHPVTANNPAVQDGVIAYAGVPVAAPDGHVLGSLCVVDRVPRAWSPSELSVLTDLAAGVEAELALREAVRDAAARERALRSAELKFRAVAESARDAIVAADERGAITFWSGAAEAIFGWSSAEVVGQSLGMIMPERFRAAHAAGMRRIAAGGPPRVIGAGAVELVGARRDGTEFPLELTVESWNEDGRTAFSGVIRDLTSRKRSESMERGYQLLFEHSPVPMWVYDVATWRVLAVNEAAVAHYGYTRDEFLALSIVDLRPPAERAGFAERLERLDRERPTASHVNHVTRDGRVREVDVVSHALPFEGRAARLVVAQDVTERVEAERRKSEFVSTVSHELRTPLTSIRGSLGLLDAGAIEPLPPKAAGLVRIARVNAERLVRLVNDFLDLEKITNGQLDYAVRPLDPGELVAAAAEGIAGMAGPARVQVVTRVDVRCVVPADRDRMLQVLTNLLSNAIKFSPPDSPVLLSAHELVDAAGLPVVRFAVEDCGVGIPHAELHLLFQKFRQLSQTAASKQGGTGLGLAITKAIVEQHGGRVGVASEPGRRTVFWCDLPAAA